jgi:hypothetical protein
LNNGFRIYGTSDASAERPNTTEYTEFREWWLEAVKSFNSRATLVWEELAWSGWFARSEVAEGKPPTVFPRRPGE